jgi:AbrB family looped-hinge helix DNA binding protein
MTTVIPRAEGSSEPESMTHDAESSMKTVTMNSNGRITLPAEVREKLNLTGETEFEVEVTDSDTLVLRPVVMIPREDAWAYTRAHLDRIEKALADIREGRIRELSDNDLSPDHG